VYEQVLADFEEALALGFEDVQLFIMRGQIESKMGAVNEAMADLNHALQLDPHSAPALASRSMVHFAQGNMQEAQDDCEQAIALDDQVAWFHYNHGLIMRRLGDLPASEEAYTQAITLDPTMAWAYHNRGNIYRDLGEFEKALADFDQALLLDPNDALGYVNRGLTYRALGRVNAALADFSSAITCDPRFTWAFQNRADLYLVGGKAERAYEDFSMAVQLEPTDVLSWAGRGRTLAILDRYEEALADCDKAAELNRNDLYAPYVKGTIYLEMGDIDQALQQFDQMLEQLELTFMNGNMRTGEFTTTAMTDFPSAAARARFGRGRTYMVMDRQEDALADFEQALRHDADVILPEIDILLYNGQGQGYLYLLHGLINAYAGNWAASDAAYDEAQAAGMDSELLIYFLRERSEAARQQNEAEAASTDLQQAIKLAADKAELQFELGRLYLDAGNMTDALAAFDEALRSEPNYLDALVYRGFVFGELGQREEAADNYCRALELMAVESTADETYVSEFFDLEDILFDLTKLEIDCYLPETEVASLPNWPVELGLPASFYADPAQFHGVAAGDMAMGGQVGDRIVQILIEDSFWFAHDDGYQTVYGYAVPLHTADEVGLFETVAQSDLSEGLRSYYGDSEEFVFLTSAPLTESDAIGDWSSGTFTDYTYQGDALRHETVSFILGESGVCLFQTYPIEEGAIIDLVELGRQIAASSDG
jgi:tetratricopeptide (TPR) repeat protein